MIASVSELLEQERKAGSTDSEIATLLRVSRVATPKGFHHWSKLAVRAAVGEDASGFRSGGHPGLGVTNEHARPTR